MIPGDAEIRATLERSLAASRADACTVACSGHDGGHLRFARGEATTSAETSGATLRVTSTLGRRTATFETDGIDAASIDAAVRAAEQLARYAPEQPGFLPPLGPREFPRVSAWAEPTARAGAERRAALVAGFLAPARAHGLTAAGLCETRSWFTSIATSAGLRAAHRGTHASLHGSARAEGGGASGWSGTVSTDVDAIDAGELGAIAASKALASADPVAIPPGRYTVVLEAAAVAGLFELILPAFDARAVDEGRSPFSRPGGGSAIGDAVASAVITLESDPADPLAPSPPFGEDGALLEKVSWIDHGTLKNLPASRYWGARSGGSARPRPSNLILRGGPDSVESMVKATRHGLLVTRFWYIRPLAPRRMLSTGVTRDGLFLIEDGRVAGPVGNLRFDEELLGMIERADMAGPARRFDAGAAGMGLALAVPPLRVQEFAFTGATGAV
ncbi:MAG: TldD/PmbA family protein [Acidobacteria bacterium]|nr:TldD/PmbA family protein [Acidobacteriota bacterium]